MPKMLTTVTRRHFYLSGTLLVGLLTILGITAFAVSGATPVPPRAVQNDPLSNPIFPFSTETQLNPTLAAHFHAQATDRAFAYTRAASMPQPQNVATPTNITMSQNPGSVTGIIFGPLSREYDLVFRDRAIIENFWCTYNTPGNNMFVVVAGAPVGDPSQGFVGVAVWQKTGLRLLKSTVTPTKHGSVHVTAVNGSLVTLVAADGTTFVFDYVTYTFR